MTDSEDRRVAFLQWALPHLGLRWPGFRKVRRQVIKRIDRRIEALQLGDLDHYREYLEAHAEEWQQLDSCCRITISRFYRDRQVFDALGKRALPELLHRCRARDEHRFDAWSAGCGAGEEAYTLVLIWALQNALKAPDLSFALEATDADSGQIARARKGCFPPSSLKELPPGWRERAFTAEQTQYCIKPEYRRSVRWAVQDLRYAAPDGSFDLILCRNLAFTYFAPAVQRETLQRLGARLKPGGLLVIGSHESLPEIPQAWSLWQTRLPIYHKGHRPGP